MLTYSVNMEHMKNAIDSCQKTQIYDFSRMA